MLNGLTCSGTWDSADGLRSHVSEAGAFGPLLFLALFAGLEFVGLPAILFVLSASVLWPRPQAILLSWVGAMSAALLTFAFTRWVAREWVATRLPDRLRRYDALIATGDWRPVAVVRHLFFMSPPADWLLGASSVRIGPFHHGYCDRSAAHHWRLGRRRPECRRRPQQRAGRIRRAHRRSGRGGSRPVGPPPAGPSPTGYRPSRVLYFVVSTKPDGSDAPVRGQGVT